jgi:dihydroorotate dehydrogenase (fumarate)
MDLSTTYLGLHLPHPLMPGASPLCQDLGRARALEDAGAAVLVLNSLFEEQLVLEQMASLAFLDAHEDAYAEALTYFPGVEHFKLGPDEYLEHLERLKSAVAIPVIASLNGTSLGGWLNFAKLMHQAGADAIELNVYHLVTDPERSGEGIERRVVEMLRSVKEQLPIPVAVKLSPFYTSLAHFARQLDLAGADGLVLFNRFYQPDLDVEQLEVERRLQLSDPSELLLRLRWLAILHGHVDCSLAVTGGVHGALDVVKSVMAGAHAVQIVSALLREGPDKLARLRKELAEWLEQHEYESLSQMQGSMSLVRCPDPQAYERANYMEMLQRWGR